MLKQNQNRGAGLVTVVTVLAVCSILLAGVVAVSFNHYKNVIRQTQSREELAEIELFVELVNEALAQMDSKDDPANVFTASNMLNSFYEATAEQSMVFENVTVSLESESDRVYSVSCGETSREFQMTTKGFVPYEPSAKEGQDEA